MTDLRLRRRSALGALPALAVLLSACGPGTPLKTGLAPVDLNVRLGNYATPVPPPQPQPVPFAALVAGFPQPFVPPAAPLPTFAAPPSTPGPPCPTAPPIAFPPVGASQTPTAPPVANRTYAFRYVGTYTSGGKTTTYPGTGTRTITNVGPYNPAPGVNGYGFSLVEKWNGYTTTTNYAVVTSSPSPENVPVTNQAPAAGIYLTQQSSAEASGSNGPDAFQPVPPLQVMAFPAAPGTPVGGHADDPQHGASETIQPSGQGAANDGYSQLQSPPAATPTPAANVPLPPAPNTGPGSQVQGDVHVDACGTVLDSWQVELIGRYTSAALGTFSFDDTYDFATEYGGVPVAEHHHASGTRIDGSSFSFDVTATIDEAPATP